MNIRLNGVLDIPYQKEALQILPMLKKQRSEYVSAGYDYAEVLEQAISEVQHYVDHGTIPRLGFCNALSSANYSIIFKKPVNQALTQAISMPADSLEHFYAIFTNSCHTEIISKAPYEVKPSFDRATCNWLYKQHGYESLWHYGRFHEYVVERTDGLEQPFKLKECREEALFIDSRSNKGDSVTQISECFVKLVANRDASYNAQYHLYGQTKNIPLTLFSLNNPYPICKYHGMRDHSESQKYLSDCLIRAMHVFNQTIGIQSIRATKITSGRTNKNWYLPNYRITLRNELDGNESYLLVQCVPLPSFEEMIKVRSETLTNQFMHMPRICQSTLQNQLVQWFQDDLMNVSTNLNFKSENLSPMPLNKYEDYIRDGRIPGYAQYNYYMNWDVIPRYIFEASYQLLETYNHYLLLQKRASVAFNHPQSLKKQISDDVLVEKLHRKIFTALKNFDSNTRNYLDTDNKSFLPEPNMTHSLSTYINDDDFSACSEHSVASGRLDIKVEFSHSNQAPFMIEAKVIKPSKYDKRKAVIPSAGDMFKKLNDAVRQIRAYTNSTGADGMLLFFTCDLNQGEVVKHWQQELEKRKNDSIDEYDYELIKWKKRDSNQIKYAIKAPDHQDLEEIVYYPIRLFKLHSIPPSKGG